MDAESEIVVQIPQGKLKGKKDKSVLESEFFCFHRIPYAKPPLGELRFKAPLPADKWTGILDATKEGSFFPTTDWLKTNYQENSSEDSLFINVYCRRNPNATGGKKYPVMVSFHGGGFEFGSGNRDTNGPDFLMLHDVVLVTFNYRIGVLGFLSLGTVECPGNYGLKDQQLALKWVKNNIGYFGGDPDNITLFGISAGAASVHYHILSASNKGLFKRVIMQSGATLNTWALARRPRENAFVLGKRMGCNTKDDKVLLDFLRKAPIKDIVLNGHGIINETEGEALGEFFLNFTFVPVVEPEHEGAFISKHPWVLMKEGKMLDVPVITGTVSKEMIAGVRNVEDYPRFTKVEEFQRLIPRNIQVPHNSQTAMDIAQRIKEFYFKNGVNLDSYIDILSDTFFIYGVFKNAKSRITNKGIKSPTYLYQFTYEGDQQLLKLMMGLDIKGTCHGDDTGYLYTTAFTKIEKIKPGTRDHDFMMKFTKLWVSFATSGVPILNEAGFSWNSTSQERLEFLELGEKPLMKNSFFRDRMEFWEQIYTSHYG